MSKHLRKKHHTFPMYDVFKLLVFSDQQSKRYSNNFHKTEKRLVLTFVKFGTCECLTFLLNYCKNNRLQKILLTINLTNC